MCGISGFLRRQSFRSADDLQTVRNMASAISYRGPDDSGEWVDSDAGLALSHRRLSILDLSDAGHQPMLSASGRYAIVFNGEIYNHLDVRRKLEIKNQIAWRGHSDTESLLAGIENWGVESTLKELVGMFAFALWDRRDKVLTLARDRIGEKPLYYGWQNDVFMFGSELGALRMHPAFERKINPDVLPHFLKYGYIPAPYSIYAGIHKLLPGTYVSVKKSSIDNKGEIPKAYWSLSSVADSGIKQPYPGDDEETIDELDSRLSEAVSLQRIADVPLGAFLSGGVDSSVVVALMQKQSTQAVKTFTIGFNEKQYNEAEYAEAIAKYLGTDHTTLYMSTNEILKSIPSLYETYDEPFSDSSASIMISRLARDQVKVALSGDGGDESFGGYKGYHMMNALWNKYQTIPRALKPVISKSILLTSPDILTKILSPVLNLVGRSTTIPVGQRMHQLAKGLSGVDSLSFFRLMKTHGGIEYDLLGNALSMSDLGMKGQQVPKFTEFQNLMMCVDSLEYLPDDILVKVDRASMAVSLETRAPLLDHRVVELAWKIPHQMKYRDGEGKWPLRKLLNRYIPGELTERPKMGFNLPTAEWLRGPLKEWSADLLNRDTLSKADYFNTENVQKILNQHLLGIHNWQALLWRIIAFQAWLEKS